MRILSLLVSHVPALRQQSREGIGAGHKLKGLALEVFMADKLKMLLQLQLEQPVSKGNGPGWH